MALITCYECGAKISDLAMVCPHCGAPARKIVATPSQAQSILNESEHKEPPYVSPELGVAAIQHKPVIKHLARTAYTLWFLALVLALSFTTAAKEPDLLGTIINSVLGACLYLVVGWAIALFLTMIKKRELPTMKQTLWAGTVITAITLYGQAIHPSVISAIESNVSRIEAEKVSNISPAEAALIVVSAPTTQDSAAWKAYLGYVAAKTEYQAVAAGSIINYYFLPTNSKTLDNQTNTEESSPYTRLKVDVFSQVVMSNQRNMQVFGSPDSKTMGDLIVESFAGAAPTALKDTHVLFIGQPNDAERVKASVEAAGGVFIFEEIQ